MFPKQTNNSLVIGYWALGIGHWALGIGYLLSTVNL